MDTSWGSTPDFDGDGHADLFVGEPEAGMETPARGPGNAFVFRGTSAGISTPAALTLSGPDGDGSLFGVAVGTGDFDGDGYADALVGAYGVNAFSGSAYVYRGGSGGLGASPAQTLTWPGYLGAEYGSTLAGVGDIDGDGYADAVVGANNYGYRTGSPPYTGRVYVYLGGPTGLSASPVLTLAGPEPAGESFGSTLASAGDVNGDGYGDVVIMSRRGPYRPTPAAWSIAPIRMCTSGASRVCPRRRRRTSPSRLPPSRCAELRQCVRLR